MFTPDEEGVYARIGAVASRRLTALALLYLLAILLLYAALSSGRDMTAVIGLGVMGAVALWAGEKMRRGTSGEILLTDEGVVHSDGTVLAHMDDIISIERGAFAMKPSNGFTMLLKAPLGRVWRPGLWWRLGRRVGVGGIVSAAAAKFMAEQIAFRIKDRAN